VRKGAHIRHESNQSVKHSNTPVHNLRTIEKAGTKGPLITLITLIMDARDLCAARACGKWARNETTGRAQSASPYGAICVICGRLKKLVQRVR
jgi:hypothetical protein